MKKQYALLLPMLFLCFSMFGQDLSVEARISSNSNAADVANQYYERYSIVPKTYTDLMSSFSEAVYLQFEEMSTRRVTLCDLRRDANPGDYFLTPADMENIENMFSTFTADFRGNREMDGFNEMITALRQYFALANSLRYTKLEIFEDFTGFDNPTNYFENYVDPLDQKRTTQGLGMYEALNRLNGLASGLLANDNCYNVVARSKTGITGKDIITGAQANHGLNAYPNPAGSEVNVYFTLPHKQKIRLSVFDINGREVKALHDGELDKGTQTIFWNGTNDSGTRLNSGLYYILIRSDSGSEVVRLVQK